MASFNATIDSYRLLLANVDAGRTDLANENFDLGEPATPGKYEPADRAYDKLLAKLADRKFDGVSPALRTDVLNYYGGRKPPVSPPTQKASAEWAKSLERVEQLRQSLPEAAAAQ